MLKCSPVMETIFWRPRKSNFQIFEKIFSDVHIKWSGVRANRTFKFFQKKIFSDAYGNEPEPERINTFQIWNILFTWNRILRWQYFFNTWNRISSQNIFLYIRICIRNQKNVESIYLIEALTLFIFLFGSRNLYIYHKFYKYELWYFSCDFSSFRIKKIVEAVI